MTNIPDSNSRLTIWLKHSGYLTKVTTPEEINRVTNWLNGSILDRTLTIFCDQAEWVLPRDSVSHISISLTEEKA
jgi:hypothetical protein